MWETKRSLFTVFDTAKRQKKNDFDSLSTMMSIYILLSLIISWLCISFSSQYDVIETKKTWEIVDKRDDYKLISLKWVFIYKSDSNNFLFKYKIRIVIRDDLQNVNNVQNVYAATFALKIFRMMMTWIADFHLKIKQLNVVNVFLNVFNDEKIYYHL
jgi:hypothetical protein